MIGALRGGPGGRIVQPFQQHVCLHNHHAVMDRQRGIDKKLGPKASPLDFDEQDLTPEHIHCGEDADSIDSDHGNLEVTPELGGNFVGPKSLIQRSGVLSRGRVTRRKRDANRNLIGQSHTNPVLDTQSYIL